MRPLIASLSLMLVSMGSAVAADIRPGRAAFEILHNGRPAGMHVVEVRPDGEGMRASSQVDLRIQAGPITLFRYVQTCQESWARSGLERLACETQKGGRRTRIEGRKIADAIEVEGVRGLARFEGDAAPASWWLQPLFASADMINTETGAAQPIRVTRRGRETFEIDGRTVMAERVRVEGTLSADLWYDLEGRWIGCAFTARGQKFEYRLTTPVGAAPGRLL